MCLLRLQVAPIPANKAIRGRCEAVSLGVRRICRVKAPGPFFVPVWQRLLAEVASNLSAVRTYHENLAAESLHTA